MEKVKIAQKELALFAFLPAMEIFMVTENVEMLKINNFSLISVTNYKLI